MTENPSWTEWRKTLARGLEAKETFREPPDWQSRVMRRIRASAHTEQSLETELRRLNPFIFRFSTAVVLLSACLQTYLWSAQSVSTSAYLDPLVPKFSAVDILWEGK